MNTESGCLKWNPITAVRGYFSIEFLFFSQITSSQDKPLRDVTDHSTRIELQSTGSAYVHCLL